MSGTVAYNPDDPLQQTFLSSLALGETGGAKNGATLGVGGTDLSNSATDAYGFPQWGGFGNSHAAGYFQFQPGTWDQVAAEHGLNFTSSTDQAAGAWYYAQQVFASKTNGGSLNDALAAGQYGTVQSALAAAWPSVLGNAANPGGLAASMASTVSQAGTSGGGLLAGVQNFMSNPAGSVVSAVSQPLVRIGLIVVGSVIILVALWKLLSDQGVVPSPSDVAETAGKVASVAAVAV